MYIFTDPNSFSAQMLMERFRHNLSKLYFPHVMIEAVHKLSHDIRDGKIDLGSHFYGVVKKPQ